MRTRTLVIVFTLFFLAPAGAQAGLTRNLTVASAEAESDALAAAQPQANTQPIEKQETAKVPSPAARSRRSPRSEAATRQPQRARHHQTVEARVRAELHRVGIYW